MAGKADGTGADAALLSFPTSFVTARRELVGPVTLAPIAGVPVRGELYKYQDLTTSFHKSLHHTVEGHFGRLTSAQFAAIKAELGGQTKVTYSATRVYVLSDFLPPVLQALLGQDIEVGEAAPVEGSDEIGEGIEEPKWVGNTSNCHGTAWAAQRAYDGQNEALEVFYGDPHVTEALALDEGSQFTKLATINKADLLAQRAGLQSLKPGDVVLFFEISEYIRATMLLHSATYVGGGLFFDKPDTESGNVEHPEETPYRLATLEKLIEMGDAVADNYKVVILRRKAPLEAGVVAFASDLEPEFVELARRQGKQLGYDMVTTYEAGTGGGIRSESADAVTVFSIEIDADGRGRIRQ